MQPIEIRPDKRFKKGNVKRKGKVLRGNPETVELKQLHNYGPYVITEELAKAMKPILYK